MLLQYACFPMPQRDLYAHHEYLQPDADIQVSSDRTFGIVLGVFFALIAFLPLVRGGSVRWWSSAVSLAFFAFAFAIPRVLHPANIAWSKLALVLQRIISPIALALLFLFGFAIMGTLLRALGKDLLRLKSSGDENSYWIIRNPPGPPSESMMHQF